MQHFHCAHHLQSSGLVERRNRTIKTQLGFSVEDGGVERHALISSYESTKIATSCWITIDGGMLEPTKKGYPTSKDKEEAAARR